MNVLGTTLIIGMQLELMRKVIRALIKESLEEATNEAAMFDNMGKTCKKCGEGKYETKGPMDDQDDVLHCSTCDAEIERYEGHVVNESEISKKGAKNQLKGLDRKTFKGKVSQVKKKMPGVKDPEAFVASRIKKATGKSPREV